MTKHGHRVSVNRGTESIASLGFTYGYSGGDVIALGWLRRQSSMPKVLPNILPKVLKSAIPAAVLGAGLWFAIVTPSYAKPEYAKKEGKACGYCHVTAGKPELNAAGDYYAAHDHSLKGYTPAK